MLRIFLWTSLVVISILIGCGRDLFSLRRVPGGLGGQIFFSFLGGWCLQSMFFFLIPRWWGAVSLQVFGALCFTFLVNRIQWEPYERKR